MTQLCWGYGKLKYCLGYFGGTLQLLWQKNRVRSISNVPCNNTYISLSDTVSYETDVAGRGSGYVFSDRIKSWIKT